MWYLCQEKENIPRKGKCVTRRRLTTLHAPMVCRTCAELAAAKILAPIMEHIAMSACLGGYYIDSIMHIIDWSIMIIVIVIVIVK